MPLSSTSDVINRQAPGHHLAMKFDFNIDVCQPELNSSKLTIFGRAEKGLPDAKPIFNAHVHY